MQEVTGSTPVFSTTSLLSELFKRAIRFFFCNPLKERFVPMTRASRRGGKVTGSTPVFSTTPLLSELFNRAIRFFFAKH
jgi:hypothetical protein